MSRISGITKSRVSTLSLVAICIGMAGLSLQLSQRSWAEKAPEKKPEESAEDIANRAVNALQIKHEEAVYKMRLIGPDGNESTRKMKVWFKRQDDQKASLLIKFQEPRNIRGTAFLTVIEKGKDPDQWLYLPSLKKSRRIRGGNSNESFLGSDFTMADISVSQEKQYHYVKKPDEKCGEATCYVLEGTPKPEHAEDVPYSKKTVYLHKDNYFNVKSHFYNKAGKLEKEMKLLGMEKKGSEWTAQGMEMENLLTRHKTVIEYEKRNTANEPGDHIFTVHYMKR